MPSLEGDSSFGGIVWHGEFEITSTDEEEANIISVQELKKGETIFGSEGSSFLAVLLSSGVLKLFALGLSDKEGTQKSLSIEETFSYHFDKPESAILNCYIDKISDRKRDYSAIRANFLVTTPTLLTHLRVTKKQGLLQRKQASDMPSKPWIESTTQYFLQRTFMFGDLEFEPLEVRPILAKPSSHLAFLF